MDDKMRIEMLEYEISILYKELEKKDNYIKKLKRILQYALEICTKSKL
jgi:chaperonin cofactor prefoldin